MSFLSKLIGTRGSDTLESRIVRDLRDPGYHVIPDFLTADDCRRIREQFERLLVECADRIQHGEGEGTSGDYRLWKVENRIVELAAIARNQVIHTAATAYIGRPVVTHAIMVNKVVHEAGRVTNSGGGWHRDTSKPLVKALIYLSDVGPDNGPFTLIPRSRAEEVAPRPGAKVTRFADETVEEFVERHGEAPVEFTAEAGTCIIADTSNVHRGKNIAAGVRYCATNYIKDDSAPAWQSSQEAWGRYFLTPA